MPDTNRDTLLREIQGLEQRMGAHLQEFRNRAEYAQLRGQLTRLAERYRQFRLRFEAAQGPEWESGKDEFLREQDDLFAEFVKFEQKLDKSERQRPERVAGAKSGLV